MPNVIRTHVGDDVLSEETKLAPKHMTKQEFARRLYRLMVSKGWNQSELARQANMPRDSVSVYVRAKSLPTPANLEKLAKALDVEAEELLPNYVEGAIDRDEPSFEMKVSPNAPAVAWLRINQAVPVSTALKIAALLDEKTADGK